jgi:hypothetical protein
VALACDALDRACTVGSGAGDPRAVLRCEPPGRERLDVYEAGDPDRVAYSVPVVGDDPMRTAALWIARTSAESRDDVAEAPVHSSDGATNPVATDPTATDRPATIRPATEAPTGIAATGAVRAGPPQVPPLQRGPDSRALETPGAARGPFGILASGRALVGSGFGPTAGVQLGAGWLALPPEVAVEVSVEGERGLSDPSGYAYAALRTAGAVTVGAPWGRWPVGLTLEGGALAGWVSAPPSASPPSATFLHPYLRAGAGWRWGAAAWGPYAGASVIFQSAPVHVTGDGAEVATVPELAGCIDVGVAWQPL